jgi:hypothetical protein
MARRAFFVAPLGLLLVLGCEREPVIRPAKSSAPISADLERADSAQRADSSKVTHDTTH